jgi:hypothetical protein
VPTVRACPSEGAHLQRAHLGSGGVRERGNAGSGEREWGRKLVYRGGIALVLEFEREKEKERRGSVRVCVRERGRERRERGNNHRVNLT